MSTDYDDVRKTTFRQQYSSALNAFALGRQDTEGKTLSSEKKKKSLLYLSLYFAKVAQDYAFLLFTKAKYIQEKSLNPSRIKPSSLKAIACRRYLLLSNKF